MKRVQIRNIVQELAKGEDIKMVVDKYLKERSEILKNSDEKDYDHVDMAEFRNTLSSSGIDYNTLKPTEKQEQLVKFYSNKVQASIS